MASNDLSVLTLSPAPAAADIGTVTVRIVRDRDGVVVIAAGPTANPSEGVWTYDRGPVALDATLTYTLAWVSSVLGDVGSEAIQAADDSRTLRGYRRALFGAGELGPWSVHTLADDSAAADEAYLASLADVDRPTSSYNGVFCFFREGALSGEQRRVRNAGFTPSSGRLAFHRALPSAPLAGMVVELCARLPAVQTDDGRPGAREIVNRALETLPQVIRLPFTAVGGQVAYGLESYPWLGSETRLGRVFDAASGQALPSEHLGRAGLRLDAERPYLEFGQAFTDASEFMVEMLVPGPRWIKSQGAWGISHVGLRDETDEALVEPGMLRQVALAYAFRALAESPPPTESEAWLRRAEAQERKAALIRAYDGRRLGARRPGAALLGGDELPYPEDVRWPGRR